MAKKPAKPSLTVTQGKTPSGGGPSAAKGKSALDVLGGKKSYKKPGSDTMGDDMTAQPGFGTTGLTGET